uniref:Uncharacterized protein n=1 Tax=Setaria viridis TaxID=4556 RepID=A0A4U6VNC9_SETVI|nr:hypothetical protein SEVIR_2G032300v2 [Setaria viridis]
MRSQERVPFFGGERRRPVVDGGLQRGAPRLRAVDGSLRGLERRQRCRNTVSSPVAAAAVKLLREDKAAVGLGGNEIFAPWETAVPPMPAVPAVTLPPMPAVTVPAVPAMPAVPAAALPPLPATVVPAVPKVTLPPIPGMPKVTLPPMPSVSIPGMPTIPFLAPPPKA